MKKLFILFIAFTPLASLGMNFEQALGKAYERASNFAIIRNDFLKDMEDFPQTLSTYFLPNINADLSFGKNKNYRHSNNTMSAKHDTLSKQIRLTQPIFNGGSGVAALQVAKHNFLYSKASYYSKEQSAILEALNIYLSYYAAKEKYQISLTSFESAKKQLIAIQAKFKIGESTQTEYATAVAGVATTETKKLTACAELEAARANFIKMFANEPNDVTVPNIPNNLPSSFEELITKVKLRNFDIESLQEALKAAKAKETVAKGKLLPQVNLDLRSKKEASRYIKNKDFNGENSIYSGISVEIPIYSQGGVEYSKIRLAKNDTKRILILKDNKIKEIETATIKSWEMFNAQKSSIIAASEGEKAAQIAYDATVEEHNVGNKTMLDVLNMLERLNKSKSDKIDVLVQYTKSAYELKALISELTAKDLKLKVDYFSPTKEYNRAKIKIIGF